MAALTTQYPHTRTGGKSTNQGHYQIHILFDQSIELTGFHEAYTQVYDPLALQQRFVRNRQYCPRPLKNAKSMTMTLVLVFPVCHRGSNCVMQSWDARVMINKTIDLTRLER